MAGNGLYLVSHNEGRLFRVNGEGGSPSFLTWPSSARKWPTSPTISSCRRGPAIGRQRRKPPSSAFGTSASGSITHRIYVFRKIFSMGLPFANSSMSLSR